LDNAPVGQNVVVYGGGTLGIETAILLKEQGKNIAILEKTAGPVQDMYGPLTWFATVIPKAEELGIEIGCCLITFVKLTLLDAPAYTT